LPQEKQPHGPDAGLGQERGGVDHSLVQAHGPHRDAEHSVNPVGIDDVIVVAGPTDDGQDRHTLGLGGPGHAQGCLAGDGLAVQAALAGDDQVGAPDALAQAGGLDDDLDAGAEPGV